MAKKDNKISMPMSGAGLVRYFDDESVGPKIAPEIVIAICVILGIFCLILRFSVSLYRQSFKKVYQNFFFFLFFYFLFSIFLFSIFYFSFSILLVILMYFSA